MREEIWTEKIFKDDAGYFLRITKTTFFIFLATADKMFVSRGEENEEWQVF